MTVEESQIKNFFKNQTIFLTGGSGFLGKILIEKLLRECQDINKIYVLLRSKKNKTPEDRFDELFSFACFDPLKSQNPDSLKKVHLITGDCKAPLLGMSQQDIEILIREITCVIHAAADVKFDQSLKEAAFGVRGTRDLLEISKKMSKLRVFLYVSTAYSNCVNQHIKEEFYEAPMKAENLLMLLTDLKDDTIKAITPSIENLLDLVLNSASEPLPGWTDNFYGVVGIAVAIALGILRCIHCKRDAVAALVPADYVSNCILAAAWKREQSGLTTIYNYVGDDAVNLTWNQYATVLKKCFWKFAPLKSVWWFTFEIRENRMWHKFCIFFYHLVPAYIVDFVFICLRRPPIAVKGYQRMHKSLDLLSYFITRSWNFDYNNVTQLWNDMNDTDKKLFFFNMKEIDWLKYYETASTGARIYLLKDPLETLPKGIRKGKILFVLHYTFLALFYYLLYKFAMFVLGFFL